MVKIRWKIVTGFLILAVMLVISGLISIYELTKLGNQVNQLLMDNYRSIDFSKEMNYSMSIQEKAILLSIQGDKETALSLFANAEKSFNNNLKKASNNLTLPGEIKQIDSISSSYKQYKETALEFIQGEDVSLSVYLNEVYPKIQAVKRSVNNLLTINQQNLNQTVTVLKQSPYRTILPGLIIIITSVVFSMIFNYMISHYLIKPINKITKNVKNFTKYRKPYEVSIDTKDEIFELNEAVKDLILTKKNLTKPE
ncbi:CHASE3 domain-containing protein [Tenuifilum thalassicum]|uniref:Chemotaxis methyl-accepting receptor HlyB-like 4HB MCP domain-containing protein n=1 Tax=Tenuifilum thalassicum TaxID=2590900 RepID=A0A7D3XKH7_9BACT|nr:MCP four helix bundle domain-containing protein [Tenuifilum thalassicum]QKG79850.1 hypothetical protein FHG85_06105 [Tenuifilum thalassicum]